MSRAASRAAVLNRQPAGERDNFADEENALIALKTQLFSDFRRPKLPTRFREEPL
jgi:hypothetical protein